jgi:hypothetical protein
MQTSSTCHLAVLKVEEYPRYPHSPIFSFPDCQSPILIDLSLIQEKLGLFK